MAARGQQQKRPQDFTGRLAQQKAAEHAEELVEKARTTALINAQNEAERVGTVVDYTAKPEARVEVAETVEALPEEVTIRVNCDLEQVTIGKGTSFDFETGRKYKVPRFVAEHLEEKGFVWH